MSDRKTWGHFGRTLQSVLVRRGHEHAVSLEKRLGAKRLLELEEGSAAPTLEELFTIAETLGVVVYLVSNGADHIAECVLMARHVPTTGKEG